MQMLLHLFSTLGPPPTSSEGTGSPLQNTWFAMGTLSDPASAHATARTVQISLKSGNEDPKLRAAHNATLSVPCTVGRKALTNILQTLLSLDATPQFRFLINEEPLRTTLEKFLIRRNQSFEETVTIVYYLPPPDPEASPPTDLSQQWLCAVHAASDELVLAGGYSATPVILSNDDVLSESMSQPHKAGIKAVSWLPSNESFLTASLDRTVRLWQFSQSPLSAVPVAQLSSEDFESPSSFTSIAVRNETAALGCENGTIWYIPSTKVSTQATTRKRPRLASLPATRLAQTPTPLPITSVVWDRDNLVTSGWEPLARYWDVEKCVSTLSVPCGGKAVTGMDAADKLLVSAVDGGVRLVDSRDGKGVVAACGKRYAHHGIVAGVRWLGDYSAVSGGFDGSLKVWDVRAFVAPSSTVTDVHKGGRCLAVDAIKHDERWSVFSAGEDGKIARFVI